MKSDRDTIRFVMTAQQSGTDDSPPDRMTRYQRVILEARRLIVPARKGVDPVQDLSLYISSGELVTIAGPAGSGITTLLLALSGNRPAADGKVLINGIDLYKYRKNFTPQIGYVPHQNAVQPDLTVFEALDRSAQLRLPRTLKKRQRRERVAEVIQWMDLQNQQDMRVGALDATLRWYVRIASEIISNPSLLFIDEPDEIVDPGGELGLIELLRRLTHQGMTVVLGTHSAKGMMLSDKVILMAQGGRLAWFGPPGEALSYFSSFRAQPSNSEEPFGFEDTSALLEKSRAGTPQDWPERYKAQLAYKTYIDGPLNDKHPDLLLEDHPLSRLRGKTNEPQPPAIAPQASAVQQFFILLRYNFKLLARDRPAFVLALILPLILAGVELLLISPQMYDPVAGDAAQVAFITALLAFLAILVPALSFMREVVKENRAYRRERQTNLKALPYVFSKIGMVIPIVLYQALVWTVVFFLAARVPGGLPAIPGFYFTLVLTALVGSLIGLLASGLATSVQAGLGWVLLLILPQLIFSGGIIPLKRFSPVGQALTLGMPTRYTFEALVTVSGYGTDLARDVCWALPENQRQSLTDQQKQPCPCTGTNIFSQCNFPGARRFFTPANQSPLAEPIPNTGLNNIPVQPLPRPGETLNQYLGDVNNYTLQMEAYQGNVSNYMNSLRQFMDDSSLRQQQTSHAVGGAEALIEAQADGYGPIFNVNLTSRWLTLLGISLVLMILLTVIQTKKRIT